MPVDPQVQVLLDQMAAMNAPGLGQMTVEETRTMMEQFATMGGAGPEVDADLARSPAYVAFWARNGA